MSALPAVADIDDVGRDVRFVPKADILCRSKKSLFDHSVGKLLNLYRNVDGKRPSSFRVDRELDRRWLFDRQIAGVSSVQNPLCEIAAPSKTLADRWTVGQQTAKFSKK